MTFKTPLVEAVAEVDFTMEGLAEFRAFSLFKAIRDEFPSFDRLPVMFFPPEHVAQPIPPYGPAVRFYSENRRRIVQYGPRVLTVNELDYPGWPVFKERFGEIFKRFSQFEPHRLIERFQLQYVNRIPAAMPADLQKRLTLDLNLTPTTIRNDFVYRRVDALEFGLSSVQILPAEPDQFLDEPAFSLTCSDVSFALIEFDETRLDVIADKFERAHVRIKELFWGLLTPETQREWEATYAEQPAR